MRFKLVTEVRGSVWLAISVLSALFFFSPRVWAGDSVPGIHNFSRVDDHVYRGAQPTQEGLEYLAKIGVRTVLDLRESGERSRAEERAVTAAGMRYLNVPMTGLTPPTEAQISKILQLLENDSSGAVFVHCRRGSDRTGAVVAAYRIHRDHWTNARALREARTRGMSFYQWPRQRFIRRFQGRIMAAESGPKSAEADLPATTVPASHTPLPEAAP